MYTFRVLVLRPCLYNREGSLPPDKFIARLYDEIETDIRGGGVVLCFSLNTNAQD